MKAIYFLSLCLIVNGALAQSFSNDSVVIAKAEKARHEKNHDLEFQTLLEADSLYPNSYDVLWRLSRSFAELAYHVKITDSEEAAPSRKEFFSRSIKYAKKAKEVAPEKVQGYFYTAVATGGFIQYGTYKEMIRGSSVIKDNIEKALEIDPKNHRAMHVLGRWHYEVARLSSFVKFVANVFYDQIPEGSFEEAVKNLDNAAQTRSLDVHRLWLAKSYLKLQQEDKAIIELETIIDSPIIEINDSIHKSEASKILKKLK